MILSLLTLAACGNDETDPILLPGDAGEIELWEDTAGNITLRTSPIENANSYTWYLNGEPITSTREPIYEFSESGEYMVAGTNGFGTGKTSLPIVVDASGRPDHLTVEILTSEQGVVSLEAKADKAWGYRWYYNDELMQRGSNSTYLPVESGRYKVQAYNASGNGDFLEVDVTIGVINLLDPQVVPDLHFRELIAKISGQKDFYSNIEAQKVTELDMQGKGITDVTGIRFFSNLVSLNLNFSSVKYLDLSKLHKLENLDLYSTDSLLEINIEGLTSIKHLNINSSKIGYVDISGLKNSLEYFNAGYSRYEDLDLSSFTKLTYVNLASATRLSRIKVDGLENLETLTVSGTPITTLDLSRCNSLKSLTTSFASNLTSLILPEYAQLEELKIARCGKGLLNNVSLDKFKNSLEYLYADHLDIKGELYFEDFVQLKGLQLDGNLFTTINLKNCMSLETVRIAENSKLTNVNLENLESLQTIYCYQTSVNELDFSSCPKLMQAIIFENSKMTSVNFTGCNILAWLSMEFCKVGPDLDISYSTNLESVTCTNTNISRIKINNRYNCNNVPFSSKIPKGARYVHEF